MKKIVNKINFAIASVMTVFPVLAARKKTELNADDDGICSLFENLYGVFGMLRTMAFIGAAFYIAAWAWDFIKAGEAKVDDVKKKGIGLLVGFSLLLLVGVVLSFVMSASGLKLIGCPDFNPGEW